MFQFLDFVGFICLFLAAKASTEQILPPQNLSLRWINGFSPELSWESPPHSMANCYYDGMMKQNHEAKLKFKRPGTLTSSRMDNLYMGGGLLSYSLQTVCRDNRSQPEVLNIIYPDLVKSLDFYMISAKQGHCSWSPVITTPELRFFYQLNDLLPSNPWTGILQECSSYIYTDGVKSGCNLDATTTMNIRMLFNATVDNTVVQNTFNWDELKVKPPAPKWTVKENKKNFIISWIPPDVITLKEWKFQINYNKCEQKENQSVSENTSFELQRSPNCRYCIWIQATSESGSSLPTDEKCFDPDRVSFSLYVVVAALVVTLTAIFIACLLRNKKHIFPKIPVPSNFFKDVIENNNESFFRKLYVPPEEQENCTVTVVRDAQAIKPDF